MCLFFRQHKILKIMSCLEYEYVNYWQHTVITSISKYKIIKSILIRKTYDSNLYKYTNLRHTN